jgi:hypothetical protein
VGAKVLKDLSPARSISLVAAFLAGFFTLLLYQRWNPPIAQLDESTALDVVRLEPPPTIPSFAVTFAHLPASLNDQPAELPVLPALEVEKIRSLTGKPARIRGRVFRVGHSAKSNTYFLNFGPSRSALTAVIFASAVEVFEQQKLPPKGFDGREVELRGEIKDHPQYGLEIVLENPSQIKILK